MIEPYSVIVILLERKNDFQARRGAETQIEIIALSLHKCGVDLKGCTLGCAFRGLEILHLCFGKAAWSSAHPAAKKCDRNEGKKKKKVRRMADL